MLKRSNCSAECSSQRNENCAHTRRAPKMLTEAALQWPQIWNKLHVLHRRDDEQSDAPNHRFHPGCEGVNHRQGSRVDVISRGLSQMEKRPISEGLRLYDSVYIMFWNGKILYLGVTLGLEKGVPVLWRRSLWLRNTLCRDCGGVKPATPVIKWYPRFQCQCPGFQSHSMYLLQWIH